MTDKVLPSADELRALLRYDPETGKLFWKQRGAEWFPDRRSFSTWNARFAGKEAFTAISCGRKHGCVNSVYLLAHRVAWVIAYGYWPDLIDHVDLDPLNNRLTNLRDCTNSENSRNTTGRKVGTSTFCGVHFDRLRGKWKAEITTDYVNNYLGRFDSEEEAALAYNRAAEKMHGAFARLNKIEARNGV